MTRRLGTLLGLLLVVVGALLMGAPAAQADPNDANPCDMIKGPAHDTCLGGDPGDEVDVDDKPFDCKSPPSPARPDEGMVGDFATPPKSPKGMAPIDPTNPKARYYLYQQYGLGGLTWHNYDTGCAGDPGAWSQTHIANLALDGVKWATGLTIELNRQATDDGFLTNLNPAFAEATRQVSRAIYTPWIGVSLAVLGCAFVFQSRKKDFPAVAKGLGWAVLMMGLATAVVDYPVEAGRLADTAVLSTAGQIQRTMADPPSSTGETVPGPDAEDINRRTPSSAVAQGNLLVGSTLYDHWLRGALGDTDSPTARKYGLPLFDSQALTWEEAALPRAELKKVIKAKSKSWVNIAEKIQKQDPGAYGYLTGHSGGRVGAAAVAALGAAPAIIFGIASSAVLVAALLVLRLLVVFLPAVVPLVIHERTAPLMHSLGKSVAAAVVNAPLFVLAAAVEAIFVRVLLGPSSSIPQWYAVVILYVLTAILWSMTRPLRRLSAVVNPNHNWAESGAQGMDRVRATLRGGAVTAAGAVGGLAAGYLGRKTMARNLGRHLGGRDDGGEDGSVTETSIRWNHPDADRLTDHKRDRPFPPDGRRPWPPSAPNGPTGGGPGDDGPPGPPPRPFGPPAAPVRFDEDSSPPPAPERDTDVGDADVWMIDPPAVPGYPTAAGHRPPRHNSPDPVNRPAGASTPTTAPPRPAMPTTAPQSPTPAPAPTPAPVTVPRPTRPRTQPLTPIGDADRQFLMFRPTGGRYTVTGFPAQNDGTSTPDAGGNRA